MVLYHGSNVVVSDPIIVKSEKGKDFGSAFYLTPIKEQAERMAIRKAKIIKGSEPVVSIYDWDEKDSNHLNVKNFKKSDLEWLSMVVDCRSKPNFKHGYDIVIGKIADDSVGETILFVLDGVITKEQALDRLKFQKINSQVAFCTEESLKYLKFKDSYEVDDGTHTR